MCYLVTYVKSIAEGKVGGLKAASDSTGQARKRGRMDGLSPKEAELRALDTIAYRANIDWPNVSSIFKHIFGCLAACLPACLLYAVCVP